jgi:hypothetical protein
MLPDISLIQKFCITAIIVFVNIAKCAQGLRLCLRCLSIQCFIRFASYRQQIEEKRDEILTRVKTSLLFGDKDGVGRFLQNVGIRLPVHKPDDKHRQTTHTHLAVHHVVLQLYTNKK